MRRIVEREQFVTVNAVLTVDEDMQKSQSQSKQDEDARVTIFPKHAEGGPETAEAYQRI
jgi:hypothetical protein